MKLLGTHKNNLIFFTKAVAERSKATDCKSVKFYFTLVRIQPALNMRNPNSIYKMAFSISVLIYGTYLFIFPKTIIQFFIDQNDRAFYVSDINFFTYRYVYTNFFFRYIVYAPFFYCRCFIAFNKIVSSSVYYIRLRLLIRLRYTHRLVAFYNHFDFSNSYANQFSAFFESQINNIEFSHVLKQYSGSFWDFLFSLICYQLVTMYIRENNIINHHINYKIAFNQKSFIVSNTKGFWFNFNTIWTFRIITFFFIGYFFCGEGSLSDFIVFVVSIIFIEAILFSFRILFILKMYNRMLIFA